MKNVILFTCIPLLVLLMLGCTSQISEEQHLFDTLETGVEAIEAGDSQRILSLLADDIQGPQGRSRDELTAMMQLYFRQYRHMQVFLRDTRVELDGKRADVTTIATIVAAREHWPNSARLYEVRMRWKKQQDDWKLQRILWKRRQR